MKNTMILISNKIKNGVPITLLVALATIQSSFAQSPAPCKIANHFNYAKNIGTIDLHKPVLIINNPSIKAGTHFVLVFPEIPQKLAQGIVLHKVKAPEESEPESSYYSTKILNNKSNDQKLAFCIMSSKSQFHLDKDHIHANLEGNGFKQTFRVAYSTEGAHLTVWSGQPLHSPRKWHGYVNLGYDTEANGTPKDY